MSNLLLTLSVLCLLLAAHPFLTYPASLWLLAQRRRHPPSMYARSKSLRFAICMCAYNEEAVIEAKVRNLLALKAEHPSLRIHVYVDACSDRTAALLEPFRAQIDLQVATERHGKTHGMNLLAARADADVLVFTDANVMLDEYCLDDLQRQFDDPQVGCVCGNLRYTNGGASVTAASGSAYWRFEEALKRLETRCGSAMGADGSIFAVRRELRRAPPDHIIDDMFVSLMVLIQGHRVVQARDARAWEASATHTADEFARKVRIACQAFNVHRLLWPQLRRLDALTLYMYISHKLLRWFCIWLLALALLCALGAAALTGHLLAALTGAIAVAALLLLAHRRQMRLLARIVDLLIALTGAGLGVWRSLRGERFQTWTPAASVRETGHVPT